MLLLSDQAVQDDSATPCCTPSSKEVNQWRAKERLLAEWLLISGEHSLLLLIDTVSHKQSKCKGRLEGNDWILERWMLPQLYFATN